MENKMIAEGIRQYQSPCYLFDLDAFTGRYQKMKKLLGERVTLCFAMKANPFLAGTAARAGARLEVCSPGEFAICERSGVPMEQIVLSGVNKEIREIHRVMEANGEAGIYTVESVNQYEMLAKVAGEQKRHIRVLLRLTAGNQFGMDEATIKEIIAKRASYPQLQIQGIQYYSGTQKKRMQLLEKELNHLDIFLGELKAEFGYEAGELEYGPGFYVPYFMSDEKENMEELLGDFQKILESMSFQGAVTLEIGRYLAASCGYYMTKVVEEKKNYDQRYGIADGGIHQLNYYGQMMAMKVPHYHQFSSDTCKEREITGDAIPVTICGSLCTVNDVLVKNLLLMDSPKNDILVFENTGAYSMTESMSLFLSRDLPRIFFWSGAEGLRLIRDRMESNLWNGEL